MRLPGELAAAVRGAGRQEGGHMPHSPFPSPSWLGALSVPPLGLFSRSTAWKLVRKDFGHIGHEQKQF